MNFSKFKITRDNLAEHLFEKQLEIIQKPVQEAISNKNWRNEWYMTQDQYIEFELYTIPLIKKVYKCSKKNAIKTFDFFRIHFGLNIK
jgi:hypothetical protein